jgi:hypothetical protein
MDHPYSKNELIEQLSQIQETITDTVEKMSPEQFHTGTAEAWSPADYLKHLILGVKSVAKGMSMPKEQLQSLFGQPVSSSRTYAELVAFYQAHLDAGVRAEDYDGFMPTTYRLPGEVEDLKSYLVATWQESNARLINALDSWEEADLDHYQLPHPALKMITVREMMFFTLHHNILHGQDIAKANV